MKKYAALFLALLLVMGLAACGSGGGTTPAPGNETAAPAPDAPNAEIASFTVGTGGESGTYYGYTGVLGTYLGQKSNVKLTVVSTGGSKDNLVSMDSGIYQLATVQSDVMAYAYEGSNTFAESGALKNFRTIAALYAETIQIVTVDPALKSVSDLRGKTVCIGDVGSGTYYNTIDVLAAYDMTLEDITPVYQSFGDSTESLKDGKIDAAFLCAGAPTNAVVELAASNQVYLISLDDEHMSELLAACPYYAAYTIPAGTYNGVDVPTEAITVKATLVAATSVSDDAAYTIVKTIFEGKDEITALHAKGAELDLTFATEGIAVPFNKGAARYFAEQGITVQTID